MKKNNKPAPKKVARRKRTPWNASEILYATLGYLTTRKHPLILSAYHEAGAVAQILAKICEANDLPKPGNNYPKIKIPEGVDEITNVPQPTNAGQVTNATNQNPVEQIMNIMGSFPLPDQNNLLREIINHMRGARLRRIELFENDRKQCLADLEVAHKLHEDFLSIIKQ